MISMADRTKRFTELTQKMIELQSKKGQDYGEDNDGLRNLRRRGQTGVVARMGDKLARLEALVGKRDPVVEESIEDTLLDLANYCLLLIILREDEVSKINNPHQFPVPELS